MNWTMAKRVPEDRVVSAPAAVVGWRLLPDLEFERVHSAIASLVEVPPGVEDRLRSAVVETLATTGSLWRAQLAWAVGRAEGLEPARALALATSVEAFHTASLLFDDLPAMDDAEFRRGRPCVHRTHGQAAAILAGLALVNEGHGRIAEALDDAPPVVRRRARSLALRALGLRGILDGQSRDVHSPRGAIAGADALRRAAGKSVPMLTLALELPALVAEAPRPHTEALGRLAKSLGLAYQLLDDLEDMALGADGKEAANATASLGRVGTGFAIRQALSRGRSIAKLLVSSRSELERPFAAVFDRLDQWSARLW